VVSYSPAELNKQTNDKAKIDVFIKILFEV
jgi:hypothetical protein